jgi:phosphoribosylformylglycinamidine synthase
MFIAEVDITLRPAILDVQGKAVENTLRNLGHNGVDHVRIGKHVTFQIDAESAEKAEKIARTIAESVLSNPIMEDFELSIRKSEEEEAAA